MVDVQLEEGVPEEKPVIYVLSDARGETANAVVMAAAAQFSPGAVDVVKVPNMTSVEKVVEYFDANYDAARPCAIFHTIADANLRREIRHTLDVLEAPSIDLLGPAVTIISTLTGEEPSHAVGAVYKSA